MIAFVYRSCAAAALAAIFTASVHAGTIDGLWQQIDDKTGRVNSLVRIETVGGEAQAYIVKGYPAPGQAIDPDARCTGCPGQFRDQRMIGLRFMWGLKTDGQGWTGGQILDPDERKIYRVNAALAENGNQLNVRGYVGVPLFGRSQVWKRYTGPAE